MPADALPAASLLPPLPLSPPPPRNHCLPPHCYRCPPLPCSARRRLLRAAASLSRMPHHPIGGKVGPLPAGRRHQVEFCEVLSGARGASLPISPASTLRRRRPPPPQPPPLPPPLPPPPPRSRRLCPTRDIGWPRLLAVLPRWCCLPTPPLTPPLRARSSAASGPSSLPSRSRARSPPPSTRCRSRPPPEPGVLGARPSCDHPLPVCPTCALVLQI